MAQQGLGGTCTFSSRILINNKIKLEMKNIFKYVLAFALPFAMMAACDKPAPVGPDDEENKPTPEVLEASFKIIGASDKVEFDFGQTQSFEVEKENVASYSVDYPKGWEADVDGDELVITAPAETAEDYDLKGSVVVKYSGEDGEEKEAGLEVELKKPETPEPPTPEDPEKVTFELIVSDITSTTAHLKVIPSSNSIRYYFDVCTMSDFESVNGNVGVIIQQYIDYLLAYNPALTMEDMLQIMLSQGPDEDGVSNLPAGTQMCFYAVAVNDEGQPYGEPAVVTFTTEEGGNAADCTFDMTISEIKGTTVFIEIVPSDPSVRYWYAVTPRDGYPGDIPLAVAVKQEAEAYAAQVGMTLEQVISGVTVCGPVAENWYDLEVDRGYYLYAFAMDAQGNAIGPVFKESFNTAETDISDAEVSLSYRYFDGDALYASDPVRFSKAAGRMILQIQAQPNFYASDWAVALAKGDYTDPTLFPDEATINALLASGVAKYNQEISTFYADWSTCTVLGFAADYDGYNGKLVRILVEPTKEGASPVEEYYDEHGTPSSRMFSMQPQKRAKVDFAKRLTGAKTGYRF